MITQSELKEFLDYDPNSGLFRWNIHPGNVIQPGDLAGSLRESTKKIHITIKKVNYPADKLAFLYMVNKYPKETINHLNNVGFINSWKNLKIGSKIQNYKNRKNAIRGVHFDKHRGMYRTYLTKDKKHYYLGYYHNFNNAVCARLAGEQACLKLNSSPAYEYVKEVIQKRK